MFLRKNLLFPVPAAYFYHLKKYLSRQLCEATFHLFHHLLIFFQLTYLKVDEDEMAAWLYLAPPEQDMEYTKQGLIDYLASKGVIAHWAAH